MQLSTMQFRNTSVLLNADQRAQTVLQHTCRERRLYNVLISEENLLHV